MKDYPVKYAVLKLEEKGGWAVDYEYITQGYIASKCYVVGSRLSYGGNNSRIEVDVVFPYEDIEYFKRTNHLGERQKLVYDLSGKMAYIKKVSKVYDTFEEAKEAAEKENENYKDSLLYKIDVARDGWKIELDKLKEDFDRNLNICYSFEEEALERTKDLEVTHHSKTLKQEVHND